MSLADVRKSAAGDFFQSIRGMARLRILCDIGASMEEL